MGAIRIACGVGTRPEMARPILDVIATRGHAHSHLRAIRRLAAGGTGGTVEPRSAALVYRSARYRHFLGDAAFALC